MHGGARGISLTTRGATRVAALICSLGLAAACADKRRSTSVDSDLARDLQLAGQLPAQPTFQDTALSSPSTKVLEKPEPSLRTVTPARRNVPRAPAPTRVAVSTESDARSAAPAPASAPAPAPSREIAAGTGISMTAGGRVCTETGRPGDKIVATTDGAVTGSNGAVIPAGSKVVLEVASVTAGQSPEQSQIVFHVRALYVNDVLYSVSGDVTPVSNLERVKVAGAPNADKKKVIGGAIAGAIIGQIMGKSTKSTVIGAATGAAAGAVVAKAGERYEGCLPEGASLRLTLTQPVAM
jgi:hypothetical protein